MSGSGKNLRKSVDAAAEEISRLQSRIDELEGLLNSQREVAPVVDFFDKNIKAFARSPKAKMITMIVAALVLGSVVIGVIQGIKWRNALAAMRAEPGVEVVSVRQAGLFKKHILGLRDPLSKSPMAILEENGISARQVDLQMTEYHSLNTQFGRMREEGEAKQLRTFRQQMIGVAGQLSEEHRRQMDEELGKISSLLLEMRFPEAMRRLDLKYSDGIWYADGELPEDQFLDFKKEVHRFILNGDIDFNRLNNFTDAKLGSISAALYKLNLLDRDLNDNFVNLEQAAELIAEHDKHSEQSKRKKGTVRLILEAKDSSQYSDHVHPIRLKLLDLTGLSAGRIRVEVPTPPKDPVVDAFLRVVVE